MAEVVKVSMVIASIKSRPLRLGERESHYMLRELGDYHYRAKGLRLNVLWSVNEAVNGRRISAMTMRSIRP